MKILFSHYLNNETHPAVIMVNSIARELTNFGHLVHVHSSNISTNRNITTGQQRYASRNMIKNSLWFGKAIGQNYRMFKNDMKMLKFYQPDLVICRQDAYCCSMPLACKKMKTPMITYADAPVAYESRHYDFTNRWHPFGLVEFIEKLGIKNSRSVITVSRTAAKILRDYKLKKPIEVVHNGVDIEKFSLRSAKQKLVTRNELGINTRYVAGFIGSFRPFHGIDILVEMIQETADNQDLTWLLVGNGPDLAKLENAKKNNPRLHILGYQKNDRIPELLSTMDALICPQPRTKSEFYFCPLKILEGMAAGVTVIASNKGDIPFLLNHGDAGVVVEHDDVKAWVEGLNWVFNTPNFRSYILENAKELIQKFTWRESALHIDKIIHSVTKQSLAKSLVRTLNNNIFAFENIDNEGE